MGLTQSKLAVGVLIFDARLCGPEGGAVVVLLHGWPEFSSWWQDSLEALGAAGYRAAAFRSAWLFPWCQTWLNIDQTVLWMMSFE